MLRASGRDSECRLAHAQYFLALAEQTEAQQAGPQQQHGFARLVQELDNFREATAGEDPREDLLRRAKQV